MPLNFRNLIGEERGSGSTAAEEVLSPARHWMELYMEQHQPQSLQQDTGTGIHSRSLSAHRATGWLFLHSHPSGPCCHHPVGCTHLCFWGPASSLHVLKRLCSPPHGCNAWLFLRAAQIADSSYPHLPRVTRIWSRFILSKQQ